jgi:hypothetical protein
VCPAGDFLCPDSNGCCPVGRTCGTGSDSSYCLTSSSSSSTSLPTWAITLIVTIPIVLISACSRYACALRAAQASNTEAFVPSSNPAYGTPPAYNGAPSYQASMPPPSYQGGGARQDCR